MGLFSSKRKTTVGTSVTRVIEDRSLPNFPKSGTIKSILQQGNTTEYILEELVNSIGIRSERMYEYAKKNYTYGLPSKHIYAATQGASAVTKVLRETISPNISLDYSRYGPLNAIHVGWKVLFEEWQYDRATNKIGKLSQQRGKDIYLVDMQLVIPKSMEEDIDPSAYEIWGDPPNVGPIPGIRSGALANIKRPSNIILSSSATEEYVRVTYGWTERVFRYNFGIGGMGYRTILHKGTFNIPLSPYQEGEDEADFFHARYILNNKEYYWIYQVGSGGHEELDNFFGAANTQLGNFFPFIYFRYGKTSMARNKNSAGYKTSEKMLKYLGLNYEDIIKEVHKNPDIGDVEQAMMIYAVPANTKNQTEIRYLFDFFDEVRQASPSNLRNVPSSLFMANAGLFGLWRSSTPRHAIVIKDRRFQLSLGYHGIYKRIVGGRIGKPGTYASKRSQRAEDVYYTNSEGELYKRVQYIPSHVFRKQVSQNAIEEIEVTRLRMTYHIYGGHTKVGEGKDNILLVPVDRTISKRFSTKEREQLYARSLHMVFNSRVVTKVKWYQRGIFKVVIAAIAIVLTAVSLGQSLVALAAIGAAFGTTVMMIAMFDMLIVPLLVSVAIKLFVDVVGPKLGIIAAVITAAIAVYHAGISGGLKNSPWAKDLLSASTGLIQASGENIQRRLAGLQSEYEEFREYVKGASELLKQGQDLLYEDNHLSPFIILGESPKAFYNRTKHVKNPGKLVIDSVHTFVDRHLTLPTFTDTLGGTFNAVV